MRKRTLNPSRASCLASLPAARARRAFFYFYFGSVEEAA
jgi:hypothetical protein